MEQTPREKVVDYINSHISEKPDADIIAKAVGVDLPTVVRIVDHLEKAKKIRYERYEKRLPVKSILSITQDGNDEVKQLRGENRRLQDELALKHRDFCDIIQILELEGTTKDTRWVVEAVDFLKSRGEKKCEGCAHKERSLYLAMVCVGLGTIAGGLGVWMAFL
jgi:DNA-binding MarR family transcriptional regulator